MEWLTQVADQAAPVDVSGCADSNYEYKNDQADDVTELSNRDRGSNGRQDQGVGDVIQFHNKDEDEIENKRLRVLALAHLFGPSSSNYTKLSIPRTFFYTVQAFLTRQGAKGPSNDTKDTGQKVFCQYLGFRGLKSDVGLDMAGVQRAMFAANIPTQFSKGVAPNEVICALGPIGGDIWMKNEGQDLIMFHEGFDNAALSRSQRQHLEKLDIIQHTLIGTKEDALEWMINGAYTRGQFAQQQILNAASPLPCKDHDKHINEALALFRDKALDAANPHRLNSIVTAWPLAQEVRQFVEDQMLFLIQLVANNGIKTILRRITSDDSAEPNIGILSKHDRKSGIIPLPRSVLRPAIGPGNIIAEDNKPKIVELEEIGNVINFEARRREITAPKATAASKKVGQKGAQKAVHRAAQKEKKARLKANRRARLGAEEKAKKTEEDKTQQGTRDLCAVKQLESIENFEVDNKKQQEAVDFELAKTLEVADELKIDNFDPTQQVITCEKPKLADEENLAAEQAMSSGKVNYSAKSILTKASPTQKASKDAKAQKTDLEKKQQEHMDFEITKQIAEAHWERVTKSAKAEEKAESQKKQSLFKGAGDTRLPEKFVLKERMEMAKAEESEKKRASFQKARFKIPNDARTDKNYKWAKQQQNATPVRIPKSHKKVSTPQAVKKTAHIHIDDEKFKTPAQKPLLPRDILKIDENVNTLQLVKRFSTPKEIFKRPQEEKRAAPHCNTFSSLHIENLAGTSDRSGKKRKATQSAKASALEPALKVDSTAEFPSLDGSTVTSEASAFAAPRSALTWSKPAITDIPPISVPLAEGKAGAFPALDGSARLIEPPANVVVAVESLSSWSDAVARVAYLTSTPNGIEIADDFPDSDGNNTTSKSSVNDVAVIGCFSFCSKTAAGEIASFDVKKSVESTTELSTFEASTTPIKASAHAVTGTDCAMPWSTIAPIADAPTVSSSALKESQKIIGLGYGSAETRSSANAGTRAKPSDLIIFWESSKRAKLDKKGTIYICSDCKEKFGDFSDLLEHLKSEPNHRNMEVEVVYYPNEKGGAIWASKTPAVYDPKTTKLLSQEVVLSTKRPLALTRAKKAAASEAPLPGLDAGTIITEVPAELIRRKKNVPLSSFSKPKTTNAGQKTVSNVSLPRLKVNGSNSHTSGASKLTFGSLEAETQASGTNVVDEADAEDDKTVVNPSAEVFRLVATTSSDTYGTGTTMKIPTVAVAESSPLVVTKPLAETGKMKRRDSINFIRTRTDSRAAQLGSPLGPAGMALAPPVTPLVLGDAVVSASGTSAIDQASTPVPECRKQEPAVVVNQPKVQEQQVGIKGKASGKTAKQFPAFQFPASLTFFGDISSNEPTGVDRSQMPEARLAASAPLKPISFATALKHPDLTADELTQMKVNSVCLACRQHGNAQIDCPFFIELAGGVGAATNVVITRHAVDGSAPGRRNLTATAEEYAEMSAKGLCLACGHSGHAEGNCPFLQSTTSTVTHAAEKSKKGMIAIAASSAGRHDVDVFLPLNQASVAVAGVSQCLACGSRGLEEADCTHYGATRAAVIANVSNFETPAPAISHNRKLVDHRKVGPVVTLNVGDTTATAIVPLPVAPSSFSAVSDEIALADRVAAAPIKVVGCAPGVDQTLNEFQIEDRSAFLKRMAALIRERVPSGQPGGEVIGLRIPQGNGDDNIMAMVLPERRVFKHKRSKSVGDKLDIDVSYYTQQEQEHFLCNQFLQCGHTPGTQKVDVEYCSVHHGDDSAAYCEIEDADYIAIGKPSVRRNSISIPHLEGNPHKIRAGSGAFVCTHKRAPAALVSRIENPASLAPVTNNIHVFCAGIGI